MAKTKIEPMVNLTVNPCKMCMPMGAVTAFYGIKKCMSMLHGSQGCSTYIRRHMSTHYNEPVDIASSSMTEQGTVYGGESNLVKGLENVIELYHPEVIGIATTCLAETIGEDVKSIVYRFKEKHPEYGHITIIPVNSPGYGGTQFEGYYRALRSILVEVFDSYTEKDKTKIKKKDGPVNVILSTMSPSDIRFLKDSFRLFEIDAIFFPDLSENLDGVYTEEYQRLPQEGISIEEIKRMATGRLTLEITNLELEYAPGKYLFEKFQIPVSRINLPVGLRDMDAFYQKLSEISGKEIPIQILKERGRYLDAMVDSHKYNGEGRAVIFGEPDFVSATVRLCVETGILPVVAATGSVYSGLAGLIEEEIKELAKAYHLNRYEIVDDVDFKVMEQMAVALEANIMIGNSEGRRMEENLNIPLVRRGFPIHDRVGGQRLSMFGYVGSLTFLDEITNAILKRKESLFRDEAYQKYFIGNGFDKETKANDSIVDITKMIEEKTKNHPCFNGCSSGCARMHLPVAPRCNIQCNYCVRKFDCPNESRPGVTTKVLTPEEALEKYKMVKQKIPNLSVVGIAGPGDALANFEDTKKTLELIREFDQEVTFCLSTNGLMLPKYADELQRLGVTHVTVTMNAVDVSIGAKIYKYIMYNDTRFEGESAAAILLANQLSGLRLLVAKGIICKVNIVTMKGINQHHIPEIVKKVNEIGCYITNIMPFIQVEGSAFEHLEVVSNKEINKIRDACGQTMKQMYHCKQCRADAVGTLEEDRSTEFEHKHSCHEQKDLDKQFRFAIASKSGMLVDQHFGQVTEFYIYEYKGGEAVYCEKRAIDQYCVSAAECDEKEDKIEPIIQAVKDCDGVIVLRIGESPKKRLLEQGIKVFVTCEKMEEAVINTAFKLMN